MMKSNNVVIVIVAAMCALSLMAAAGTVLIDEDFNNPQDGAVNGTNLRDNPLNFPDWNFADTAGLTPEYKTSPTDGVPTSAGDGYVKFDSFSGSGNTYTMQYDTGHNWSVKEKFTLSINATEQEWNAGSVRTMVVAIKETARTGNDLTGATLWTVSEELILDPDHDSAGEGWGTNNTISWEFYAADFTNGTPGTAISFELSGAGSRGYYFDNVAFTVEIPPPSGTVVVIK